MYVTNAEEFMVKHHLEQIQISTVCYEGLSII